MADIIKIGRLSVCRKPCVMFNDGEYFPVEIQFSREITDRELEAIASLAMVINERREGNEAD